MSEWEDYRSRTRWGRGKRMYDLGTEGWKAECGRELREAGAVRSDTPEAKDLTNKVKHIFLYLKHCHCVWRWSHSWPFERRLPRAAVVEVGWQQIPRRETRRHRQGGQWLSEQFGVEGGCSLRECSAGRRACGQGPSACVSTQRLRIRGTTGRAWEEGEQ